MSATNVSLNDARSLVEGVEALSGAALERAKEITHSGKLIDEHQVLAERVAYAATEARAARELFEHASGRDRIDPLHVKTCVAAVADLAHSLSTRLGSTLDELGLGETAVERIFPAKLRALMRQAAAESVFRKIGRAVAEDGGRSSLALDEIHEQVRQSVRSFADSEVAPHAERIHRHDELVPEELISKLAYAAARAMDEDERAAAPLAAQAKLFACDVAVEVAQEGQLLHGGWGYAEEYAISRYVVDSLVLPIFEGVKPILELKVIARSLLG